MNLILFYQYFIFCFQNSQLINFFPLKAIFNRCLIYCSMLLEFLDSETPLSFCFQCLLGTHDTLILVFINSHCGRWIGSLPINYKLIKDMKFMTYLRISCIGKVT